MFKFSRIFLCLLAVFSLISQPINAKLVAWYPLDESALDTNLVATENIAGNDATTLNFDPDPEFSLITRGSPSARQNLGSSYLFTKGGGLDLTSDLAVQPTDKFTISFWCQPGTLDNFDRFIDSKPNNSNDQNGIRIDMGGSGNGIRVQIRDGNGAVNTTFTHPTPTSADGTWYFFAFRYDSAGIDNVPYQLTVIEASEDLIDGAGIAAATAGPATINVGAMTSPHAMNTLLGLPNAGAAGNANGVNNLHAAMDEIAYYDNSDGMGVLSDAQLADVYNFGPSAVELISSFTTDLDSISPGNPATLSWEVNEPFDTLILDDGAGNTTDLAPLTSAGTGTIQVTPAMTTNYSIRATRGEAANVYKLRILAGAAPAIDSFTASATIISTGESVDLSWSVTGADSLQLDPGAVDVSALTTINQSPAGTTTFILSATNGFGTSTAQVTVSIIDGPVPAHRYFAVNADNTDALWIDEISGNNWAMANSVREAPLTTPSPNTNIGGSFSSGGDPLSGGAAGAFLFTDLTIELWFRPGALTADHQVIFETGGGQNGVSALITETDLRFLGTALDTRNLDITLPLDGLNLDDFIQVVVAIGGDADTVDIALRDTFGNVRTASESATNIVLGVNGAGLFTWGAGGRGGDPLNLGGQTNGGPTPEGLTGFAGEIAIVNIFDRVLDTTEIQAAFDSVATTVDPPVDTPFSITRFVHDGVNNTAELTWNSISGNLYDAQFSTDMTSWNDLSDTVNATAEETTKTFNLPPNQPRFYLRIIDLGAD